MAILVHEQVVSGVEATPLNKRYVFFISAITALGGVLFGFDLAIISGTIAFFSEHFALSEAGTGWAVGCINLGAALGAMIGGKLADSIGRKKLLLACAILFAVTGIWTGWATTFSLFVMARIVGGMAIGCAALVCPMYLAEIAPAQLRGRLVSFYQLAITLGILSAYLANYLLLDTGANNWRWMFASQAIPSFLFLVGLLAVPESPRWLFLVGRGDVAIQVLKEIGGRDYAAKESHAIYRSLQRSSGLSVKPLAKGVFHIIAIGIMVALFSQLVGQNSILSYAPEIFKQSGVESSSAFLQSVVVGGILCVFTVVAIVGIDRAGRRKLLLWGAGLLALDASAIALAFYLQADPSWILLFILLYIAVYAATLGPVTWVVLSEIFPNAVRGTAMSISTLALWIANFATTSSFPILKSGLGMPATFAIHGGIALLYVVYVGIWIPETKGKSLEEIQSALVSTKTAKHGD